MVEQKFKNKKAILMASGPSLTEEIIEKVRPHKDRFVIFGCNDIYRAVDYLDIHYACDTAWWDMWGEDVKEKRPDLESWTQCEISAKKYGVKYIKGHHKTDFSTDPEYIHYGSNSGYQQLNLAFLMGCSKFILLGYNMQRWQNKSHYFGEHPGRLKKNSPYPRFVQAFNSIHPAIKALVVNCTENTALKAFRIGRLEDELL